MSATRLHIRNEDGRVWLILLVVLLLVAGGVAVSLKIFRQAELARQAEADARSAEMIKEIEQDLIAELDSKALASVSIPTSMDRGLAFLAGAQNEDGSFGGMPPGATEGDVGITSLAVWAWATSPAEVRKKHDVPFGKGVAYILAHQQEDGSILNVGQGLNTYKTATAIMALQAADPEKHKEAIEKARDYLAGLQFHEGHGGIGADNPHYGSWGYKGGKPSGNLSTTQFALDALKEAGLSEDDPAWKRAIVFLQRCQNRSESNDYKAVSVGDDGGFRYDPGLRDDFAKPTTGADGKPHFPSYASMTYAGLKSLLNANLKKDDPRVQAAVGWIRQHFTLEENYGLGTRDDPSKAKQGLYYYYLTLARALDAYGEKVIRGEGGEEHAWAEELATKLTSLQREDGSWVNEEDRWWEADPVLVTGYAVCTLAICTRNQTGD